MGKSAKWDAAKVARAAKRAEDPGVQRRRRAHEDRLRQEAAKARLAEKRDNTKVHEMAEGTK